MAEVYREPVILVHLIEDGRAICSGLRYYGDDGRYTSTPRMLCPGCDIASRERLKPPDVERLAAALHHLRVDCIAARLWKHECEGVCHDEAKAIVALWGET